jgi:hypothetical protein
MAVVVRGRQLTGVVLRTDQGSAPAMAAVELIRQRLARVAHMALDDWLEIELRQADNSTDAPGHDE